MLKDSEQRLQAIDPSQSFIVQAPAGSGKTELLTQRYLRLLSTVSAPEQIVALTFTRKAASEMRERILSALHRVKDNHIADSPHQQLTNDIAKAALNRSEQLNWQLIEFPSRLKILTIDSLCQSIIRAIPLQEQPIPYASISMHPKQHYLAATRQFIQYVLENPTIQPALQTVLNHLDNRLDQLIDLFSSLLAMREQWLPIIYASQSLTKEVQEEALQTIITHELTRFKQAIPVHLSSALYQLSTQVARIESNHQSARYALIDWYEPADLDVAIAQALAALLLTKDDKFRKSFDHHVGLKRGSCPNTEYDELKRGSQELLAELEDYPDFLTHLIRIKSLPLDEYADEQWDVLQALLILLPLLAAHLHLTFREANEVDFNAVAEQAVVALGDESLPTDLALYFDHSIHHLLIDEFQDTSLQQFALITRLTQGWLPNEGKTLFVVGDPMQSIYRFRQAEVGLFLKARHSGIGNLRLQPLELACNFRSTENIVGWINQQFKTIFPAHENIESGAISFYPSQAQRSTSDESFVAAFECEDKKQEAEEIANVIAHELANYANTSIAVLVRSRSQLAQLIKVLHKRNIAFQGVEIEALKDLAHIKDIWSLTKALLMPANRLAWLAFLRSPWCGLALEDIFYLANFNKKQSIYLALSKATSINTMSSEGMTRATYIYQVMSQALANRHQKSLVDWIMDVLEALHSDVCFDNKQRADIDQFLALLEHYSEHGLLRDPLEFEASLNQLYSQKTLTTRLQIMTIHKSKGLEFDCVILPSLGTQSKNRDKPLLRWMNLPTESHSNLQLISPIRAAYKEQCLVYDYLADIAHEKEAFELQRLLYVAVTRAKKRLYLFDHQAALKAGTCRYLLRNQTFERKENIASESVEASKPLILQRLPLDLYTQAWINPSSKSHSLLNYQQHYARQIGIVTHKLLQWICDHHPTNMDDLPWQHTRLALLSAGLTSDEVNENMDLLRKQIQDLFADPIGQWIIQKHPKEKNEYELVTLEQNRVVTKIIDRTFYYQGERWIIDFKTGQQDPLAQAKHREQVAGYAKLFGENAEVIRVGLYYLASGEWVNWRHPEKNEGSPEFREMSH